MSIEYSALDSGLERFIHLDKGADFIDLRYLVDRPKRGCMKRRRGAVRYPENYLKLR
jgi:hypothetical protein